MSLGPISQEPPKPEHVVSPLSVTVAELLAEKQRREKRASRAG